MNLAFCSETAVAPARAFAAGRPAGHSDAQYGCARRPATEPADDAMVAATVATIVIEPAKLLAHAS